MSHVPSPKKLSKKQLIEFCASQLEFGEVYSDNYSKAFKEPEEFEQLIKQFGSWGRFYEMPMNDCMGKVFTLTNLDSDEMIKMVLSPDLKAPSVKKFIDTMIDKTNPPQENLWLIPHMLMTMHGHIRCLEKFAQGMDQLLAKGNKGDDKAFLQAIRIDPAALHSPSLQVRLCHALLKDDQKFLQKLSKALSGKSPDLPSDKLDDLRFLMGALIDSNYFEMLSRDDWSTIFVDELSIYPKMGKDSYASCKKQIQIILKTLQGK